MALGRDESIAWDDMTYEQKNHELFLREKETLDLFLMHGAITKAQYDQSLHDLCEKMSGI